MRLRKAPSPPASTKDSTFFIIKFSFQKCLDIEIAKTGQGQKALAGSMHRNPYIW